MPLVILEQTSSRLTVKCEGEGLSGNTYDLRRGEIREIDDRDVPLLMRELGLVPAATKQ